MKASSSTLPMAYTTRASAYATLLLGVALMMPLSAQTPERDRMAALVNAIAASRPSASEQLAERVPLAAGTELLVDGGFEGGFYGGSTYGSSGVTGPWTWSNSPAFLNPIWQNYCSNGSCTNALTGTFMVYFSPFGPQTQRLYQTVSIPTGVTATLSFWAKIGTFETTHTMAYDTLTVSITDTSGVALGSATYSNLDDNAGYTWVKHTLDVSAYAGRTVRLQFDTYEDSTGATVFMVDDVSILSSTASSNACTDDAFTMCLAGGRYKVTSHWRNQYASPPAAENLSKTKLTDTVGAFWIADANTYEYLIRVQTGTPNGKAWIAIPTFTDVEFWVSVTDTVTNQLQVYHSAPGNKTLIYDPNTFSYP